MKRVTPCRCQALQDLHSFHPIWGKPDSLRSLLTYELLVMLTLSSNRLLWRSVWVTVGATLWHSIHLLSWSIPECRAWFGIYTGRSKHTLFATQAWRLLPSSCNTWAYIQAEEGKWEPPFEKHSKGGIKGAKKFAQGDSNRRSSHKTNHSII